MSRIDAEQVASTLRALPNEWLPIVQGPSETMSGRVAHWRRGIRVKVFAASDAGRFEFRLKSAGYGTGRTWAYGRFIPRA